MSKLFNFDPSVLDSQKLGSLAARGEQKLARLRGTPEPIRFSPQEPSRLQDNIDMAQSSALTSGGLLADAAKNTSNYVFGSEFDSSEDSGYSNKLLADEASGLRPEARTDLNNVTNQIAQDYDQGNYGNALLGAISNADKYASDSLGSVLEGAAGVALTPFTGGASLALTGAKVGKAAVDTNKKFKSLKSALDFTKKTAKQSGILTTTETQRIVQQYQAENDGELPSLGRVGITALGALATQTVDLSIMKKLYVPGTKTVKEETLKLASSLSRDKSAIAELALKIGRGSKAVLKASGAEAFQEYVQTWHEILSVNVDPETGQSMSSAIMAEINNPENKTEAAVGGIIGSAAGGATRGAITAPALAAGASVDATVAATKGTYKATKSVVDAVSNRSNSKALSEEEKRDLNAESANTSEIGKQKVSDLNRQQDIVNTATSLEELKADSEIAKTVEKLQQSPNFSDEALQDPEAFKEFKKVLTKGNKVTRKVIEDRVKSSNLSYFNNRSGNPKARNIEAPTQEQTDALVASVTPRGEESIQAAKELETNLAIDTVNRIAKDATIVSKRALVQAKELSVHDLERVAAIVSANNPATAKELQKMAKRKVNALRRFTPSKDKIINDTNIDSDLVRVAKEGISNESTVPYISAALSSTMHKNIDSSNAVKVLQDVISQYEKSEAYKQQGKGVIQPSTIAKWKKRLELKAKTVKKSPEAKVKEDVKDTSTETQPDVEEVVEENPTAVSTLSDEELAKERDAEQTDYEYDDVVNEIDKRKKAKLKAENEKVTKKEEKSKGSERLRTELVKVAASIKAAITNKESMLPILEAIPKITSVLRKEGYRTNADFDSLIAEYPVFKENDEIYNFLKLEMYNPDEEADVIPTKELTREESVEAYNKLYPECKI